VHGLVLQTPVNLLHIGASLMSGRLNNFLRNVNYFYLILFLIISKLSFCSFRETLSGNLTFNSTCKWMTLMTNQCIPVANIVKFQLSGLKSEYNHFCYSISTSKAQSGKQLPPMMPIFLSYYYEQLRLSRTH